MSSLPEVGTRLGGVALDLRSACEEYLNENFDGGFPTWSPTHRGGVWMVPTLLSKCFPTFDVSSYRVTGDIQSDGRVYGLT